MHRPPLPWTQRRTRTRRTRCLRSRRALKDWLAWNRTPRRGPRNSWRRRRRDWRLVHRSRSRLRHDHSRWRSNRSRRLNRRSRLHLHHITLCGRLRRWRRAAHRRSRNRNPRWNRDSRRRCGASTGRPYSRWRSGRRNRRNSRRNHNHRRRTVSGRDRCGRHHSRCWRRGSRSLRCGPSWYFRRNGSGVSFRLRFHRRHRRSNRWTRSRLLSDALLLGNRA
jgi:hypothetical protein